MVRPPLRRLHRGRRLPLPRPGLTLPVRPIVSRPARLNRPQSPHENSQTPRACQRSIRPGAVRRPVVAGRFRPGVLPLAAQRSHADSIYLRRGLRRVRSGVSGSGARPHGRLRPFIQAQFLDDGTQPTRNLGNLAGHRKHFGARHLTGGQSLPAHQLEPVGKPVSILVEPAPFCQRWRPTVRTFD